MKIKIISLVLFMMTVNLFTCENNVEFKVSALTSKSKATLNSSNDYKSKTKYPNITLSTDLFYLNAMNRFVFTHKQMEGYYFDIKRDKGYTIEEIDSYSLEKYRLVSEDKKEKYKIGYGEPIIKYGDELFYRAEKKTSTKETFAAFNVKTGKKRILYRDYDYCIPVKYDRLLWSPMIYKDKIYYVEGDDNYGETNTPKGYISVSTIDGQFIEHIKLPKFNYYTKFLGIAYDKFYYVSSKNKLSKIVCCNLDGSGYKVVAKGFKYTFKTTPDLQSHISFDNTGWYFRGAKKKNDNLLCKLNFKTGKVKIFAKDISAFDVGEKFIYYVHPKTKYVYRLNKKTGKTKLFYKRAVYEIGITGNYLYCNICDAGNSAYQARRVKITGPDAGKKIEKIWYLPEEK